MPTKPSLAIGEGTIDDLEIYFYTIGVFEKLLEYEVKIENFELGEMPGKCVVEKDLVVFHQF